MRVYTHRTEMSHPWQRRSEAAANLEVGHLRSSSALRWIPDTYDVLTAYETSRVQKLLLLLYSPKYTAHLSIAPNSRDRQCPAMR